MIGRHIAQFEIISQIGKGGMGEVYLARDSRLDRDVALKVLPPEFSKDPERLARFRREAKLLASLNHTNIAALHGLEEAESEVFLVMELVEGLDLSERLELGSIELDETLDLALQLAEGLEAAHEQSIVHRDLKPANLKVTPDGQLKILDFGLGRAYVGDNENPEDTENSPTITAALTGHGVILGTAAYMSPEQARGRKIDQRTDIWAFGLILFEMLSGKRVFTGETISDTMAAVLRADIPWDELPGDTPSGVLRLLERCLERDGRRRLRDIGEARVRLERWKQDPGRMHEALTTSYSTATDMPRQKPWLPWALCGLSVLVAVFLGWQALLRGGQPESTYDLELAVFDHIDLVGEGNKIGVSPDGRWLAWATRDGIVIRDIASRETRVLDGTANSQTFCFSPDSRWLAAVSESHLKRVSVRGGTPIRICEVPTPRGVAWVEGGTLVFSSTISSGFSAVDIETGEITELTQLDTDRGERSHRWPTAVPGQRKVLFECQFLGRDYDQGDICLVDLDTKERQTVHRGGAAPVATGSGELLFVREGTLFAMKFDGKTGAASGLPVPVRDNIESSTGNQEDDDGSAQFCIDQRGNLLYIDDGGVGETEVELAWFDIASGELTPLNVKATANAVQISPDGRLAVFSRVRDGNENLVVIDLETSDETLLTRRESVEYMGAWSPDSKTYYWTQGSDSGDRSEVWTAPVDGSEPPTFVAASPVQAFMWTNDISPDGRYLAASVWMGADMRDVVYLDLEDPESGFHDLAVGPGGQSDLRWIDQDHVVYADGGARSLVSTDAQLSVRRFPDTGAQWSAPSVPGGFAIGVPIARDSSILGLGAEGAYRIPVAVEGSTVRIGQAEILRVWSVEERRRLFAADPHPDGDRLLCLVGDDMAVDRPTPTLVLVTGWGHELKSRIELGN